MGLTRHPVDLTNLTCFGAGAGWFGLVRLGAEVEIEASVEITLHLPYLDIEYFTLFVLPYSYISLAELRIWLRV